MRRLAPLLALALLAAPASRAQAPGPPAHVIFNGRDLDGWSGDPRFWSVEEGAITGRTTPQNPTPGNTFLVMEGGPLRDFELRLKFRIRGGNSGVQYRSRHLGNWVVSGYQADFEDGDRFTGIAYEERGRGILAEVGDRVTVGSDGKPQKTGSVGDPAQIRAAVRRGDWNEYVITARGNHLRQAINGTVTAEVTDEDPARRAAEGIIALQLHAGPPMTVQFKDIVLTVF